MSDTCSVPLTRGYVTRVDASDLTLLAGRRWLAHTNTAGNVYAASRAGLPVDGKRPIVFLHRLIMSAPAGVDVDHISGDSLDNRRANLRLCSRAENSRNAAGARAATSQYKGVHLFGRGGRWRAQIRVDGRLISLGLFNDENAAAVAYDVAARRYHGEFAWLNFGPRSP